jgi:hypothetical protein
MYEVRFFKVDKFDYEIGEEKWVAGIKTDFVPRVGDSVAVLPDEDSLEVVDVKLYYDADEENKNYNPVFEVYLILKDAE